MYGQAAGGAHDSAGARLADDLAVTGRIRAETDVQPSVAARRECDVLLNRCAASGRSRAQAPGCRAVMPEDRETRQLLVGLLIGAPAERLWSSSSSTARSPTSPLTSRCSRRRRRRGSCGTPTRLLPHTDDRSAVRPRPQRKGESLHALRRFIVRPEGHVCRRDDPGGITVGANPPG